MIAITRTLVTALMLAPLAAIHAADYFWLVTRCRYQRARAARYRNLSFQPQDFFNRPDRLMTLSVAYRDAIGLMTLGQNRGRASDEAKPVV